MHDMWGGKMSCGHCDKKFSSEGLKRHMMSVNGSVKRQCPECKQFYANVYSHIQRFHKEEVKKNNKKILYKICRTNNDYGIYQEHKGIFNKR